MGYRHDREPILAAAVDFARANGLSALTYGRIARELGIADRTIVYYFPWKSKLIEAVIGVVADDIEELMAAAVGDERVPLDRLLEETWRGLEARDADVTFGLVFELVGLAAAGAEPYATLARDLFADRVDWIADRVDVPEEARSARAAAAIAAIDGLMLVRLTVGPAMANQATQALTSM